MEIKKIIIPVAGLGTRFLPLSKVLPKEFFPLADKPVIHRIVEEARSSGISEIIFVTGPKEKMLSNYFKGKSELEEFLIKRKKENILKELKEFQDYFKDVSFSFAVQQKPLGDGHAVLQAKKLLAKNESVAVSFSDDIVDSSEPIISQLINIFKTCSAPVIALKSLPREKLPAYGVVSVEKIASRLYKIKKIVEKPDPSKLPSDLAIVGKYVLTPEVFDYLKTAKPTFKGEIILAETFGKMLDDGKTVYGYEFKGEWLECGDKLKWLKSFLYFALKDQKYGKELREYIKTIKL